jgi:type VI protein secretion system component VasK
VLSKQVTLAAGTSQTVNFTITGDAAGKHQVEVAGLKGEFEVTQAAKPSQINWWLMGGIIAAIILALAIWMLVRRRAV